MATRDMHQFAPAGPHTGPCASCGAALAADQRYCLACGTRRPEARLPFRDVLRPAAAAAASPDGRLGALPRRVPADLQLLAGLACLLLALGIGVLIGRAGDDAPVAVAPPPAITVQGGAAPAAAATPAAGKAKARKARRAAGAAAKPASTGDRSKATQELENLEKLSPEQYQKQSQKLPKQVGTGGKAPPVDPAEKKKPAGGGSDFKEIG